MYTSNDSKALALLQQNYWKDGKWRFTGALGAADLRLGLLAPDQTSSGQSVDWRVEGSFVFAKLARKLRGDWYGGVLTRMIDAQQSLDLPATESDLNTDSDIRAMGLGVYFEYDTRDMPSNSYSGRHLKVDALFNDETIGSDSTYQSYSAAFRSYHNLSDSLVPTHWFWPGSCKDVIAVAERHFGMPASSSCEAFRPPITWVR
jgi:hypothetical protein